MSKYVCFEISIQGLVNTPMKFEIKFTSPTNAMTAVTQIFQNINGYLFKGYNIPLEHLFVFVNVI